MIGPEAIPDRDYTTHQAADLCDISINTLLSWERRYGVPRPRRNGRGERVYIAEDIRQIRRLQTETAGGIPIGEAVRRLHEREGTLAAPAAEGDDVIVTLDAAPDHSPAPSPAPSASTSSGGTVADSRRSDLLMALERLDRAAVTAILSRAALESDPATVAAGIVVPVAEALARRDIAGTTSPATLIVANRWLAARLGHWLDVVNPSRNISRAIVVVAPEHHEMADVICTAHALGLARLGMHVIDLPPDVEIERLIDIANTTGATRIELLPARCDAPRRHLATRAGILRQLLPASVAVSIVSRDDEPLSPPPFSSGYPAPDEATLA